MAELKRDIANNTFLTSGNLLDTSERYKKMFGTTIVERAYASIGNNSKILRENGNMYIKDDGTLNFEQKGHKVKEHNFYGK